MRFDHAVRWVGLSLAFAAGCGDDGSAGTGGGGQGGSGGASGSGCDYAVLQEVPTEFPCVEGCDIARSGQEATLCTTKCEPNDGTCPSGFGCNVPDLGSIQACLPLCSAGCPTGTECGQAGTSEETFCVPK